MKNYEEIIVRVKKEMIDVVIALDTSGSVSDQEYIEFLSEMQYIGHAFKHVRMSVISCDAAVEGTISENSKGYGLDL